MIEPFEDLLREYGDLLERERCLRQRKEEVKQALHRELAVRGLKESRTPFGLAALKIRTSLKPVEPEILKTLSAEDLLPFASFSQTCIKAELEPKYGPDRVRAMFDIEATEYLYIRSSRPEVDIETDS